MPSLSGVQDVNNKATAVDISGGGVAIEVTNNEVSSEQQVSPSEVQYSSRTSDNGISGIECCPESSDISITANNTANTLSSLRNNNNDVTTNANQSTTVKTTYIKNNNNVGTPTFNSKQSIITGEWY